MDLLRFLSPREITYNFINYIWIIFSPCFLFVAGNKEVEGVKNMTKLQTVALSFVLQIW